MANKEDVEALKAIQQAARQTQIIRGGVAVPPEEIAAEQVRRFRQLTSPPPPSPSRTLGSPEDRKGRVKPRRIPVVHDAAPHRKAKKGLSLEAILGKLQGAPFGKFVEGGYRTNAALLGAAAGPIPVGAVILPSLWAVLRLRLPNVNDARITALTATILALPFGVLAATAIITNKVAELLGGAAGAYVNDVVRVAAAVADCVAELGPPPLPTPLDPFAQIRYEAALAACIKKKLAG